MMPEYQKKHPALLLLSLAWCGAAHGTAGNDVQDLLPLTLDELFATPVVTASRQQEQRTDSPAGGKVPVAENYALYHAKQVEELFDRRYYAAHASGSTTFVNMPQPPRSAMLTLEYRY